MIYIYLYLLALLMLIALGAAMRHTWVCVVSWTIALVMAVVPIGLVIYAFETLDSSHTHMG